MSGPSTFWLADGKRLHLRHGPIDLIIEVDGAPAEIRLAYAQAIKRFETVLTELVDELPDLRRDCPAAGLGLRGTVARRMEAAVLPFAQHRITPMAAVAGSVADEMLLAMTEGRKLTRAYVNNGGDIALVLGDGEQFSIAMVADPASPELVGRIRLSRSDDVGGIATSGRHGRSNSLGIADSVTALATNAAIADAAATLIANAVDLPGHPGVTRLAATELNPDSDLGERLVTVDVAGLDGQDIDTALDRGEIFANAMIADDGIKAVALSLRGRRRLVGDLSTWPIIDRPTEIKTNHSATESLEEACFARG